MFASFQKQADVYTMFHYRFPSCPTLWCWLGECWMCAMFMASGISSNQCLCVEFIALNTRVIWRPCIREEKRCPRHGHEKEGSTPCDRALKICSTYSYTVWRWTRCKCPVEEAATCSHALPPMFLPFLAKMGYLTALLCSFWLWHSLIFVFRLHMQKDRDRVLAEKSSQEAEQSRAHSATAKEFETSKLNCEALETEVRTSSDILNKIGSSLTWQRRAMCHQSANCKIWSQIRPMKIVNCRSGSVCVCTPTSVLLCSMV